LPKKTRVTIDFRVSLEQKKMAEELARKRGLTVTDLFKAYLELDAAGKLDGNPAIFLIVEDFIKKYGKVIAAGVEAATQ